MYILFQFSLFNLEIPRSLSSDYHKMDVEDIINRTQKHNKRPKNEGLLLAWLEYNCSEIFGPKTIDEFDDCLSDGLVFIATTLVYCPFLKDEFFNDIFTNPANTTEVRHVTHRAIYN